MRAMKVYMRQKIGRLAWPVVLEMSWIMVVNMLVTAMVGQFGAVSLAAVGLATMVHFSAAMVFAAAGTGSASIVARAIGASDQAEVRRVTAQALQLGAAAGLGLSLLGHYAAPVLFALTGAEAAVAELAIALLRIVLWFAPFYLMLSIGNAILRGTGETRLAFWISSFSNTVSLVITYLLLFPLHVGPVGAAWGLGLSQGVGGLVVVGVLWRHPAVGMRLRQLAAWNGAVVRRIIDISLPAGLEQLSLQGGRVAYTFMLAEIGATQFAAHQIALQVEGLSFMPGFAFSVAAMTLVGQHLGRGLPHRAEQYAWLTNRIAIWSMSAMGLAFLVLAQPMTSLFINEPEVIHWGALCVMIAALEQPTIAITYVLGGALRGAGDTRWPMYITTIGVWCIRMPLMYLAIKVWHYPVTAAWFITAGDFFVRSVILWWRFATRRLRNLED